MFHFLPVEFWVLDYSWAEAEIEPKPQRTASLRPPLPGNQDMLQDEGKGELSVQ